MQHRDKVKTAIKGDPSKEAVQAIRSIRDGKLLTTLEKDSEKMGRLEDSLKKAAGNLAVKKAGSNDVHVRGLDATTDKDEVVAVLQEKLGARKDSRVSDLRLNRNNTQGVTIVMRKQDADSILAEGSLTIGTVRCRLERRIGTERCYRCWSFDHKTANCDGPHRTKACYRCGAERHEARDCGNEEACPLCQKSEHKAGGRGCDIFRSALNKVKRATNVKETRTLPKNDEEAGTSGARQDQARDNMNARRGKGEGTKHRRQELRGRGKKIEKKKEQEANIKILQVNVNRDQQRGEDLRRGDRRRFRTRKGEGICNILVLHLSELHRGRIHDFPPDSRGEHQEPRKKGGHRRRCGSKR
jgi:hypothetical protein